MTLRGVYEYEYRNKRKNIHPCKVVLQELSRPGINWSSLSPREVQVVRRMTEELEGVPNFMARLISQLVGGLVKKKGVDVGVQTE